MNRFTLILAISMLSFSSCIKEDPSPCCIVLDLGFDIAITDSLGNDLLDRNNPAAFKEEHVRLFLVENGQKVEVVHSTSRNFFVFEDTENDRFIFRVFLGGGNPIGEHIIQWNNQESDTFLTEIENYENGSVILQKVWHEDDLVFDSKTSTKGAFIELKK